jgi:hypothetical protein
MSAPGIPPVKPHLPAVIRPRRFAYGDFDRWIALGKRLDDHYRELTARPQRLATAEILLVRWSADELADAVAWFAEASAWFERAEFYESPDRRIISRHFVAEKVASLVGAFPNASPGATAIYTRVLVDQLIAAGASASRIELVTRTLIRTLRFVPTVSEVLAALAEARTPGLGAAFEEEEGVPLIVRAREQLAKQVAEAKGAAIATQGPPA